MSDRQPPTNNGLLTFSVPRPTVTMVTDKFPQGAVFLLCAPEMLQPEFVRLPEEGEKCAVTGLSRSRLQLLLKEAGAKIKQRVLRQRGATRGILLIDRASLVSYIHSLPEPEWCGGDEDGEGEET